VEEEVYKIIAELLLSSKSVRKCP